MRIKSKPSSGVSGSVFPKIPFVLWFWFRVGQERKSGVEGKQGYYPQEYVVVT